MSVLQHFSDMAAARSHCKEAIQFATSLIRLDRDEKSPVAALADLRQAARRLGISDTTPP